MVRLTRPTAGSATLSGRRYIDLPNPGLGGRRPLRRLSRARRPDRPEDPHDRTAVHGPSPIQGRGDADLVGLEPEEASRRVRDYSLGIRQRLGIDPAGIRRMRGILRGHADRGGTVLLSSRLLDEIEVLVRTTDRTTPTAALDGSADDDREIDPDLRSRKPTGRRSYRRVRGPTRQLLARVVPTPLLRRRAAARPRRTRGQSGSFRGARTAAWSSTRGS